MVTPANLADTLHMVLHCARGRIGEAIEQSAQATLDAWDAQQKPASDPLADDPEYAELVRKQLEIGERIAEARQERAWQRLYGATADDQRLVEHGPSTNGTINEDCTTTPDSCQRNGAAPADN